MERQIAQLWAEHHNFLGTEMIEEEVQGGGGETEGKPDQMKIEEPLEDETEALSLTGAQETGKEARDGDLADINWMQIKHEVHTKLWHAQSDISMALDTVQMLLEAARQRRNRTDRLNRKQYSLLDSITAEKPLDTVGGEGTGARRVGLEEEPVQAQRQTSDGHPLPLPADTFLSYRINPPKQSNQVVIEQGEFMFTAKEQHIQQACEILSAGSKRLESTVNDTQEDIWQRLIDIRATADSGRLLEEYRKALRR
ncbi:hypothetical protein EV182_004792 [Spiromyces aspiralis]|uniref:Uncharacterized protein n=1 Tax=Spiromyces aspiralis TaxID=68401 RepID=A0ACC1HPF2_9FUNG|nr:hypothetical protein EV182_004792 [Spiromyces aspiralis]